MMIDDPRTSGPRAGTYDVDTPGQDDIVTVADALRVIAQMNLNARRGNRSRLTKSAATLCTYVNRGVCGSIAKAELFADADGAAVVGLMFNWLPDTDEKPIPQSPRIFDILFFAALVLMSIAGVRVYFHDPKRKENLEYYLRAGPHGSPAAGERIYVARIIRDTPAGVATPFALDHHSYRYVHLAQAAPLNNLPPPIVGRCEAIELTGRLFEKSYPGGAHGNTAAEIVKVLTRLLETATAYHGKREGLIC